MTMMIAGVGGGDIIALIMTTGTMTVVGGGTASIATTTIDGTPGVIVMIGTIATNTAGARIVGADLTVTAWFTTQSPLP